MSSAQHTIAQRIFKNVPFDMHSTKRFHTKFTFGYYLTFVAQRTEMRRANKSG